MWFVILISIGAIAFSIWLAYQLASAQNTAIDDCLGRKRKHDKLFCGELTLGRLSNSELILLSSPLPTHVGMGGIGPCYNPSFTVFTMILDELARRRDVKLGKTAKIGN